MQGSLMERLSDEGTQRITLKEFRDAVSADLEALLNTRSEGIRKIPDAFEQCRKSSLTFGIPDFSSYSLLSPADRERIRRGLAQAIASHEPRLKRVGVTLEPQEKFDRALRFRVDGLLDVGADRERVRFDAVLQLATQVYAVR